MIYTLKCNLHFRPFPPYTIPTRPLQVHAVPSNSAIILFSFSICSSLFRMRPRGTPSFQLLSWPLISLPITVSPMYLHGPALSSLPSNSTIPAKPLANPSARLRHRALPPLPPHFIRLRNHLSEIPIGHSHSFLTPPIRTVRLLGFPIGALASPSSSMIDRPLRVRIGDSRRGTRQDMRHRHDEE